MSKEADKLAEALAYEPGITLAQLKKIREELINSRVNPPLIIAHPSVERDLIELMGVP